MSAATRPRQTRPASWRPTTDGATARAVREPRPRTERAAQDRPQLSVVRALAPARGTLPYLLLLVAVLVGSLMTSMVLNAKMADTAYRMKTSQVELNVLNDHIATVRDEVERASSSDQLAQRAAELGMVPAAAPGVVDLTTGQTSGGSAATSR